VLALSRNRRRGSRGCRGALVDRKPPRVTGGGITAGQSRGRGHRGTHARREPTAWRAAHRRVSLRLAWSPVPQRPERPDARRPPAASPTSESTPTGCRVGRAPWRPACSAPWSSWASWTTCGRARSARPSADRTGRCRRLRTPGGAAGRVALASAAAAPGPTRTASVRRRDCGPCRVRGSKSTPGRSRPSRRPTRP
jgi:hypothetical protein